MRTPRLFLAVFAFALIHLSLLLACSGSDEPADGPSLEQAAAEPTDMPDSTRATDESETPAFLTMTPTTPGSVGVPTATDVPVPAAATASPAASGSSETERDALVALYNATVGENWRNSANWLSDAPLGEWEGVTTDSDGRVTGVALAENRLSGEIPSELGNLANLTYLGLWDNQLSGEIPPELGNLVNLETLILADNQLSGPIPSELGNLANLKNLYIALNRYSGGIPPELGSLANLQALDIRHSQLIGPIPPELGNLANLETVALGGNQLTGEIPPEFGKLANLRWLSFTRNQLRRGAAARVGQPCETPRTVPGRESIGGVCADESARAVE